MDFCVSSLGSRLSLCVLDSVSVCEKPFVSFYVENGFRRNRTWILNMAIFPVLVWPIILPKLTAKVQKMDGWKTG